MDIQTAKNIINDIVDDLTGRRGLRQEWEQIDEDIISEILEVWQDIVLKHAVLTSAMHSDGEKQCNCVSGRAQSTGGCPIHGCTF